MLRIARLIPAVVLLSLPAPALAAPQTVRVPQDVKDLQQAINTVADGGVIEVAANTYKTPPRGYSIENERKGFTIRAIGAVVLDGQGVNQLLHYENGKRDRGKLVTFEGIAFRRGFSTTEADAGGVTLSAAEARFVNCVFEDNQATGRTSGGGAVRVLADSDVTFSETSFRRNTSLNRGGAIEIIEAAVEIQGGELADNRVNLPGHIPHSSGGAVYILDGTLSVSRARFRNNQAGWVGGAIYAFGRWTDAPDTPASLVQISRSTFDGNLVLPDAGVAAPGPTTGGAIHVEDQSTLEVDSSVFSNNVAEFGGAVDSYRALVAVRGSWFFGNRAPLTGPVTGAGGAIFASSVDFADASTGFGAINRRSMRLTISDSLLQGNIGGVGSVAHSGGCLLAGGDGSRVYGENGVPAAGTLEENRARVEIRRTAFADCDIEPTATNGAGSGGAIQTDLVDLLMEDSMVLDCDARGTVGTGGGMAIGRESNAVIVRSAFARNSAERWGGAIFVSGSTLQVGESYFFSNEISPGDNESINESRGAAIFTMPLNDPNHPRSVSGVVASSVFSSNVGLPIWDNEAASGPVNQMRYNANAFYSTSFGSRVYVYNRLFPGGLTPEELNSSGRSDGGNTRLTSAPRLGAVLAVPPFLGFGGEGSPKTFLAYAWSGRAATLAGQNLSARAGLLEATAAGDYALAVDGGAVDSARVAASACTSGATLCLNGDRFVAEVAWKAQGKTGSGQAVSITADTGYFWFFSESNVELMVKVIDGRPLNGAFWVFYGALSNVEYTLKITDTVTGRVKTYKNPAGRLASVGDTSAFPAGKAAAGLANPAEPAMEPLRLDTATASSCVPGPTDLCLNNGRFRVSLNWKAQGTQGAGQAVPLTADTGYFWFFSPANIEVALKVLDGRGLNGHFWVFYGALTNVEYEITVTDTETGHSVTYRNPAGQFASRADTSALPE
ncbi:MAG: right-handed parallel beta-helix repeat-containing protein [Acidobacteriota bacterium]